VAALAAITCYSITPSNVVRDTGIEPVQSVCWNCGVVQRK
jgi:hypothetical protein